MSKQQTAVEWFYDKIKSHFENDGDLLETIIFTMAIAKQKEREQIINAVYAGYNYDGGRLEEMAERYYGIAYNKSEQP